MTARPAPLDLSGAEMLVLFDWLSRSSAAGAPIELSLVAPLSERHDVLLQQARDDVLGRG